MRDQCSSCIHKFHEPHMVIMAANKTKMLVDEYMSEGENSAYNYE